MMETDYEPLLLRISSRVPNKGIGVGWNTRWSVESEVEALVVSTM